jgi:phage protein D
LKPEGTEPRAQAQWHFREVSRERVKKMTGSKKKLRAAKLTPITVANGNPATTNPESESAQKSARSAMPESASSTPANAQRNLEE